MSWRCRSPFRVLIAWALAAAFGLPGVVLPAAGQVAPAGNAHPEDAMVAQASVAESPFGSRPMTPTHSVRAKHAFAEGVDLTPLRGLAVFHNGRVKVLDTLARETVRTITGKPRYHDTVAPVDGEGSPLPGKPVKLKQDPLFTLFDVVIDPGHYAAKPLIGIDYLPLRRAMVEMVAPGEPRKQERLLVSGRVSPVAVEAFVPDLRLRFGSSEPHVRAINAADDALLLYGGALNNMLLIAPDSASERWTHVGRAPADSGVVAAAAALGDAWRSLDVARANAAIAELASLVPAVNAEQYPAARRDLELAYNRSNAFEWGMWLYGLSFVTLVLAFGTGRGWLKAVGAVSLVVAVSLHASGFALRCVIAERFAIQNQFESMTGLSLFAALVGLGLLVVKRQWLFAAATAGVGFLVLVAATQTAIPGQFIEREAAILNTSVLLKYHVTTVLSSYGLISLGFIVSLFYLGTHYASKLGRGNAAAAGVPQAAMGAASAAELSGGALGGKHTTIHRTLADLDKAQLLVLQLAFWTLGVGILLGAWWADHSWGRWWAFDPKETWALVTWIIYLIVIHVRLGAKDKGLVTAWLSVVGFVVMLWTYFGVNLLLPGLHAYA
ncbi:MAG: cytochrome c biogenesis protein CcsA [Planctomycetota bacterium]